MQLFVNSPGTMIVQKDLCFRLKHDDRVLDLSPLRVESIVVSNRALLSTQAVALALEHNIDVVFLDAYGDPIGRVWFSKMGSTALIRRRQLEAMQGPVGVLRVVEMVLQKLENQQRFLKKLMYARRGMEEPFTEPLRQIGGSLARMAALELGADSDPEAMRGAIMGLEGTAGRAYFGCLSVLMPEKYRFKGRSRRPARDPFNACLNYCYGILYSLVEKACILSGLDPFVGFLHTDNYNKKSLVFDLIEPFRIYAEQVTVHLFTGRRIKDEYFDTSEEAVSLNDAGKPVVVDAMNRSLDEKIRYRRRNVRRRHVVQHEAHRLANLLLAEEGEARPEWLEIKEF